MLDRLARQRAGPEQGGRVAQHADHRQLDAERAGAAVEDHGGAIAELGLDMRPRWSGLIRPERLALGAAMGSSDRASSACATGWAGRPERDRVEPGADQIGDAAGGAPVQSTSDNGPGQKASASIRAVSFTTAYLSASVEAWHMHDQRIEARPLLGGEDLGDGGRVERIGAEPIDGLGREGDDIAAGERLRGR